MTDDFTRDHNAKARKDKLVKAFHEYEKLHAERKEIGEQMTDITKVIKANLAISPAAFKNAFKLWQMEQGARDTMFESIRECFDALGIGQQASFLDALEKADISTVGRA